MNKNNKGTCLLLNKIVQFLVCVKISKLWWWHSPPNEPTMDHSQMWLHKCEWINVKCNVPTFCAVSVLLFFFSSSSFFFLLKFLHEACNKSFSLLALVTFFPPLSSSLRCSLIERYTRGRLLPLPEPLSTSGHACPASPQCLASEHEPTLVEEAGRRVLQSGVTFSERLWRGVWDFVSGQVTIVYNCVTFYIPDLHGCFHAFLRCLSMIHEFHHNLDSVPAKGTIWRKESHHSQLQQSELLINPKWSIVLYAPALLNSRILLVRRHRIIFCNSNDGDMFLFSFNSNN